MANVDEYTVRPMDPMVLVRFCPKDSSPAAPAAPEAEE